MSLGWNVQGDRRETDLMLLTGVRGAFCRQEMVSTPSQPVLMHLVVLGAFGLLRTLFAGYAFEMS